MSTRIPEPPSGFEAEGVPDPGDSSTTQEVSGDPGYGAEPPHDTALAVHDTGTTAQEQVDGEGVSGRVLREEPDVLDAVDRPADESQNADTPFAERAGQGVGRLVEPDQGARSDSEADMVAEDVGTDLGGYTAEESAMHVEPEV